MTILLNGEKVRSIQVMKKKLWTPARKNFPMVGKVSDIKVWDNFDPRTGTGKLIDFHKGGDNTISSGATANMLQWLLSPIGETAAASRYFDGTYYFPSIYDFQGSAIANTGSLQATAPFYTLFRNILGLKGGAAGLNGKQSALTNLTPAWVLTSGSTYSFLGGDNYTIAGNVYKNITMTRVIQTAGQPASYTWNITVTSNAGATPYTIDSIAWEPLIYSDTWSQGFALSATSPTTVLGVTSGAPILSSNSAAPTTTLGLYITALFVLPYLITVNPNGAFQFTYTFQGN